MNQNPIMMAVQMLNAGRNPMAMFQQMAGQSPQIAQYMQMINGKNPQQLQEMAQNMAKERGIDLNQLANQLGISLPTNI